MKFIVNNKIYDTEKATFLCEGIRYFEDDYIEIFGFKKYLERKVKLLKTNKNNYFFTVLRDYDKWYIRVITEDEAKQYLMHNNYDKYVELFGELEEA